MAGPSSDRPDWTIPDSNGDGEPVERETRWDALLASWEEMRPGMDEYARREGYDDAREALVHNVGFALAQIIVYQTFKRRGAPKWAAWMYAAAGTHLVRTNRLLVKVLNEIREEAPDA